MDSKEKKPSFSGFIFIVFCLSTITMALILHYDELASFAVKINKFAFYSESPSHDEAAILSFPDPAKPIELLCSACAYVTGSGHMIDSKMGKEIDSHDCIIRSNDSPVTGYENDVGRRTTLRTVDHRSLEYIKRRILKGRLFDTNFKNSSYVVFVTRNTSEWDEVKEKISYLHGKFPGMKFYITSDLWLLRARESFKAEIQNTTDDIVMSNGFLTLLFLRQFCDKIEAFGITYPEYCFQGNNDVQFHYYYDYDRAGLECATFRSHANAQKGFHRFFEEKKVFLKWRTSWGNLHFNSPKWP